MLPTCLRPGKTHLTGPTFLSHYLNVSPGHSRPAAPEKVLPGLSCGMGSGHLSQEQLCISDREVAVMVRVEKLEIPVKLGKER